MSSEHTHEIIMERRKPGEYKALMKARDSIREKKIAKNN